MSNRLFAALIILAFIAVSCGHVDTVDFEKVYFESVAQKVAKAEGFPFTPTATATGSIKVPAGTGTSAKEQKTPAAVLAVTKGIENRPAPEEMKTGTAVPTATMTPLPKEKKKRFKMKELEITSDSMSFNKDTQIAVFRGNVLLVSEGVRLKCDLLSSKNYKDNAEASGNVRAFYKEQKTSLKCGRIKYGNEMSDVLAYDGVVTEQYLDKGNTITMYADEVRYEAEYGIINAKKIKKRVKVVYEDIVAFSDKVIYNDENAELEMSGKAVVIKDGSSFTAVRIKVDTVRKTMKMESDIWTRIFYGDLKKDKEVKLETDKNTAPR